MKKIFTLITCAIFALGATAQTTTEPDVMVVKLTNGEVVRYQLDQVENLSFENTTTPVTPEAKEVYAVSVPTFGDNDNWVKSVVNEQGVKVAEIDREMVKYLKEGATSYTSAQRVVIYPVTNNVADLTKGICLTDGASVVWDTENNTVSYTPAEEQTITTVYVINGEIALSAGESEAKATQVDDDVIMDMRNGVMETYRTVKIGTQYWMAQNLDARAYTDGTALESYTNAQLEAWAATTNGAYVILNDDADNISDYVGAMYNGYAVINKEHSLAPAGWEIPTYEQLNKMNSFVANTNRYKLTDGFWTNSPNATNLSGFSADAGGYFSKATSGETGFGSDCYWWSSTVTTNWLKQEGLVTFRITNTSRALSSDDCHDYAFGHYIRCVKKQ